MILKILTILILLLSGLIDGILEGWGFDGRKSFEKKYKVSEDSFWGSKRSQRAYTHPNLYNKVWGTFDFYHMADKLRKGSYLLTGMLVIENYKAFFEVNTFVLFLGVYFVTAGPKIFGMEWIRN